MIVPHVDAAGVERWSCPVPLLVRYEARKFSWDEHLQRDADALREEAAKRA